MATVTRAREEQYLDAGDSCGPPATPAAVVNDLTAWYGPAR
jgi:hypothetical protein